VWSCGVANSRLARTACTRAARHGTWRDLFASAAPRAMKTISASVKPNLCRAPIVRVIQSRGKSVKGGTEVCVL
jgi:hypothetical protein